MPDLDAEIRLIEPGDRLTGLSLGDSAFAPLMTFLQKHARIYEPVMFVDLYKIHLVQT